MSSGGSNYANSLQNMAGVHGVVMCEYIARAHSGVGNYQKRCAVARRIRKNAQNKAISESVGRIYVFVLVDYRNKNEQIKKKSMSQKEAWSKNEVLAGTGLAWAKLR